MNLIVAVLAAATLLSTPRIDRALAEAAASGGGGVLLVRRGDRVLIERAWGAASCDGRQAVGPRDLFDIGSITKLVTAAAVLKAVDAGQLTLQTTVGEVFSQAPEPLRAITVEQLLRHRSGLVDSIGLDETLIRREHFLQKLFGRPLDPLEPGQTRYSNSGYTLLAAMLEERTGTRYETYIRRELFRPAGVDIGYAIDAARRQRLVCGTLGGLKWGSTADYFGPDGPSWYLLGAGGLLSSAGDLDRWLAALWDGKLLSPVSTAMIRDAATRTTKTGRKIFFTSGSNTIFSSHYERWLDDGVVLILFTSHDRWAKETLIPMIRPEVEELVAAEAGRRR